MSELHEQAKRFGIVRPKLEYERISGSDGIDIIRLTKESELLWAKYITDTTRAKIEYYS